MTGLPIDFPLRMRRALMASKSQSTGKAGEEPSSCGMLAVRPAHYPGIGERGQGGDSSAILP